MRVRRRAIHSRTALAALWLTASWLFALSTRANDFEEFEAARSAYEAQDYARAAQLFEALGGGETPALNNRSLVLESKKYLAASYLFLGKLEAADSEFERLLRLDPEYVLDPLGFPEEVQRAFARVKARIETERKLAEDERRHNETRSREDEERRAAEARARWSRLTLLAESESVHEVRSRWLGLLPFGVGQFQNGHDSLGAILAVSQGSLVAIGIVSWIVHERLRGQHPADSARNDFRLTEQASRYTNQISMGLFAVLAITGIIDAQLRFESSRDYERKRPLPPDLYNGPEVSIGPTGASLRLRF